jgi:thiamine-monophosphate kinase
VSDLGHILQASNTGASIEWDKLPLSLAVNNYIQATGDWEMPLTAGDDYELCFTMTSEKKELFESRLGMFDCACSMIGEIDASPGLRLYKDNKTEFVKVKGFEHFNK